MFNKQQLKQQLRAFLGKEVINNETMRAVNIYWALNSVHLILPEKVGSIISPVLKWRKLRLGKLRTLAWSYTATWRTQELNPGQPDTKAWVLNLFIAQKRALRTQGKRRLPDCISSRSQLLTNVGQRFNFHYIIQFDYMTSQLLDQPYEPRDPFLKAHGERHGFLSHRLSLWKWEKAAKSSTRFSSPDQAVRVMKTRSSSSQPARVPTPCMFIL